MKFYNKLKEILKKGEKRNFENIAKEWVENKKTSIKESTYFNYIFIIEKYLEPEFRGKNIEKILNYNYYIQQLLEKYSTKTVRDIISVLKAILKYYEIEYNCTLNIKKINVPKLTKQRIEVLSVKEKTKLEKYCIEKSTLKTLGIVLCLNTGMRIGEICGLKWKNIDLDNRKIYIDRTIQRIYDKNKKISRIIEDIPKTECSVRTIPINKKIYSVLKKIRKNYKDNDYFLSGEENRLIEPRNYQYTFKSILEKNNIKPYKFHILRHTFATNCIEVGMDAKTLSEILGHSDVEVTLDVYVHSSDKIKKKYLEKL